MKSKLIIAFAFLLALGQGLNAQDISSMPAKSKSENQKNMTPEEKAKQEANKAEKELVLNTDQKSKWEQAALLRINSNKPFRDKLQGSTTPQERKDLKSKMKENAKIFDNTVNGFLTAEQKTKWESVKKEKKKEMNHHLKSKKIDDLDSED